MRSITVAFAAVVLVLMISAASPAQSSQSSISQSVPRLINISGVFRPADGQTPSRAEVVTLAIYAEEGGGSPLWQETQRVAVDPSGRYTLLLGATEAEGIPLDAFTSGEARWLGMVWSRPGEVEGPRVRLTSVPYALRAADAETLGGKPASAYLLASTERGGATTNSATTSGGTKTAGSATDPSVVLPGTPNVLVKYITETDVGLSSVFETNGFVGIGTGVAFPYDALHVRFADNVGARTGIAVQNLGFGVNASSGMLFYDQAGRLGAFQGYNNASHGYTINNIGTDGGGAFNGSLNFLIGNTSRLYAATNGNIGLGTTAPDASLKIANRADLVPPFGPVISNTAAIKFADDPGGGLGDYAYIAQIVKSGEATTLEIGNNNDEDDDITFRSVAGRVQFTTPGLADFSPQGTLSVGFTGYRGEAAGWAPPLGSGNGGLFLEGAECEIGGDPSSCHSGGFYADGLTAAIWSSGDIDILHVYDEDNLDNGAGVAQPSFAIDGAGNIRVGFGAIGCVMDGDGTILTGTCASDERLKKDVRPFEGGMLERALKLRPVYYRWRPELAPNRLPAYAGDAYGLIAQDVEKVYPEMVSTTDDGYKAVDYGKLPYVLLGALTEEHAKVQALEARLAKLESDGVGQWHMASGAVLASLAVVGFAFYRRNRGEGEHAALRER